MNETISGGGGFFPGSDGWFLELIEQIDLGIAWLDANFQVVLANSEMGRLVDRPIAELVGRHCHEIFWDQEGHWDNCPGKQAIASRAAVFQERGTALGNGQTLQVRIHIFPTFARDGSISGFLKIVGYVNRHFKGNGTRNATEENPQPLADVAPAMDLLSNPAIGAGVLDLCRPALTGNEKELKPLQTIDLVVAERVALRTTSLQKVNATLMDEIAEREELIDELKTQQRQHLQQHNELSQLFTMVRRGKMEWELILDCIEEVVVLVDGQGRIKRCNKALVKLVGKAYRELLGQDFSQVFENDRLPITDFFRQGVEVVNLSCEIGDRCFLLNSYWLNDHNYGSGAVITFYDYTRLRRLTRQLEDSHRMLESKSSQLEEAYAELQATQVKILAQEKMATIGQLAAGVAHEINNPIGFISSNLRTLEKYFGKLKDFIQFQDRSLLEGQGRSVAVSKTRQELKIDYITEDVVDLIAESLDGAERVRKIVQDLKTFSRVNEAEWKAADLMECLESTITIVWNELKYKATLVRDYAELPPVGCYPHQISQVFMNLLLNAAQAIDKEGRITVKTSQEGEMVQFSVSDTGCGIPKEHLGRLFDPFFTTKPAGHGTGLGLSLSYEIVKKHQGVIWVESELGQGTTFTVRIPIDAGEGSTKMTV